MAEKKTTKATAKNEETKISLKDKFNENVEKGKKVVKANWKPFTAGFGTATGIGLLAWLLWKIFGVRPAANANLDYDELPNEEDPYLESEPVTSDSAETTPEE